ncbi:hypothetical protein UFOVP1138_43 [uncultured Caudovirales phage]|uniref:Uncharacterized protein n=1 Tax=uncultured Caudovirales phage TaxID=2100421 RepID=A0A6J5PU47_9CAUD|nr:hypothetical protein UFOVP975_78 [uncultured Caudovirales phage]CAB4186255.1 hypothetical protein UFOVP1138_43 [uncultured Caudovirales phage]CAB4204420.1 hypothetical protein UFOVP1394_40 [uncultured Caudovirales phage]
MTEEQLRLISRLSKTQEGKDYLAEVLKPMLLQNHIDILSEDKTHRDELIGFGNCLMQLITLFETCDIRLSERSKTEAPMWA